VLLFAFSAGDSKEIYTSNAAERLNTSLGPRRASIDIRRLGRRIANHMKAMRCTSPPKYLYILCLSSVHPLLDRNCRAIICNDIELSTYQGSI